MDTVRLWTARQHIQHHLAALKVRRAHVCGCMACGDQDKAHELDALVLIAQQRIAELGDAVHREHSSQKPHSA